MTDTTDVLEQYEFHVQISEEDVRDGDAGPWERVVAALAAEVRALRETLAESSVTTDDALRAWMGHMSGQAPDVKYAAALACVTELELDNDGLRRQLALQEPDAALGRVVDRIPVGGCLRRSKVYRYPHWRVEPFDCHDLTRIGWSSTPIAALERENAALRGGL